MPSKPPPAPAKGTRHPGAGRVKGTPNKISVEVRQLVSELVNNAQYQWKLRHDFEVRKVHPTIEALIWTYHLGKPKQTVELNATVDVSARIEEERRVFAGLDVGDLEQLAAESQRLVDRAMALSRTRLGTSTPPDIVVEAERTETPAETLGNSAGSDNGSSVNPAEVSDATPITPDDTAS